jgi:hypothetical protein
MPHFRNDPTTQFSSRHGKHPASHLNANVVQLAEKMNKTAPAPTYPLQIHCSHAFSHPLTYPFHPLLTS